MASCCLRCGVQQQSSGDIAGQVSGSDPETKHSEPNWFRRFCQKICPGCFNGNSTPATKIEAGNEKLTTPCESANVVRIPGEQEDGVLKEEKSERNGVRSSNVEQASERKGKGNASLGENE
ncbi:hypothetical protein Pint_26963 [Pistacia integerrima]|uniref:Uncharacterized protein n=1 Tax=Pistacia integerrima TaxID=434235 RepID=A0ACC0YRL8_9ROSI|nr:hypothetical protein Pint_26963 [Pistacia integerrima]